MTRSMAVLLVTVALAMPSSAVGRQAAVPQCQEPLAAGFQLADADDTFWRAPWVFDSRARPFPALDRTGLRPNDAVQVRLDDGSVASLRVESRPCGAGDDCAPSDCGCPLHDESLWIEVTNAAGRRVSRMHFWAAYRMFQIVPVDLVDGPGDELLIVRVPAHSAPPSGFDLKIWKIGASKPVVLGGLDHVARVFSTMPIACARWRTRLSIDPAAPKPRAIGLQNEFASQPCCRLVPESMTELEALRRAQTLRFDVAIGKYVR